MNLSIDVIAVPRLPVLHIMRVPLPGSVRMSVLLYMHMMPVPIPHHRFTSAHAIFGAPNRYSPGDRSNLESAFAFTYFEAFPQSKEQGKTYLKRAFNG